MLELKNLVFEVPVTEGSTETKRIIDDLSLTIPDDSFTVITGPNGGGKSTLAKLIMGIEHAIGQHACGLFSEQVMCDDCGHGNLPTMLNAWNRLWHTP